MNSGIHLYRRSLNLDASLLRESKYAPVPVKGRPKRAAVVLDCEMVGVKGKRSECISLTAVDFFTGEVLVNSLVNPSEPITQWRTPWTGVTPQKLRRVKREGRALHGFEGARAELFKHVDLDTILIGHALNNDLRVLRIVHHSIIDSQILARNAIAAYSNPWGLRRLSEEFLGIQIQNEENPHSSLEDATATREIVLCFARDPQRLKAWGVKQRMAL
ncbi:hypothetical protein VTO42DRAFT_8061 [Malbranchea cinnamomea]